MKHNAHDITALCSCSRDRPWHTKHASQSYTSMCACVSVCMCTCVTQVPGQGEMRHGTEGWRSLESNVRAIGEVVQGAGASFVTHTDTQLVDTLCR